MDYLNIIASIMKHTIEKYGLWQAVSAFLVLFCLPILIWKLDAILTAIHLYL